MHTDGLSDAEGELNDMLADEIARKTSMTLKIKEIITEIK